MRPGDRLVCAFVEPQAIGAQFKDWPLHITIVPWFRVDLPSAMLGDELAASYVGSKAFEVSVLAEAQFGYKKRKTVNLVTAPDLFKLEGQTRRLLHAHKAWVVDEADNTRRGFRPHVTHLGDGRLKLREGDKFLCGKLYIVEQKGDIKEIAAVIDFRK